MPLTQEQKAQFYLNPELAKRIILAKALEKKGIVYGAQAINAQVPYYLQRHTEDIDVYVPNPKKTAIETEKELDKAYGGDFFSIKKAKYPRTWKIKSNVTKRTIADFTKFSNNIKTQNVYGIDYEEIGSIENKIKRTIRKRLARFRQDKDMEALQRIRLARREMFT